MIDEPKTETIRKLRDILESHFDLTPDEQVSLTHLLRDLDKENIQSDDFDFIRWLSTRPQDQQALGRKILR